MTLEEIFNILNIAATKDENVIKAAYREKLKVTNPEDNPEGFKRLRAAYEAAVNYARTTEEECQEEEDDTPSGRWVKKAEAIYKNMDTRRSVLQWESLFDDDIFMSLEGEEQCGRKLLIFLMDNYYLPTEVWKLLDEKLHISQGSVRLKEMFPENFINFIVSK
ncbi:MAG: J domain-containing protein, partial [Lachnospiraceae bacterium]